MLIGMGSEAMAGDVAGSLFLDAFQRVVPWIVEKEGIFVTLFLGIRMSSGDKHMSSVFLVGGLFVLTVHICLESILA